MTTFSPDWISDDLKIVLFVVVTGVLTAIVKDAFERREADLPWFGWDLRRFRRWQPHKPDP